MGKEEPNGKQKLGHLAQVHLDPDGDSQHVGYPACGVPGRPRTPLKCPPFFSVALLPRRTHGLAPQVQFPSPPTALSFHAAPGLRLARTGLPAPLSSGPFTRCANWMDMKLPVEQLEGHSDSVPGNLNRLIGHRPDDLSAAWGREIWLSRAR